MEAGSIRPGYELWRPNREKPEANSARALVVFLLLLSAGLALVITVGGWSRLEGGKIFALIYIALYVLFAFLVARWNRGSLPVISALAIILAIFAGIAAPAWFDRAKPGLTGPALPDDLLGLLCLVLVPVQVVLIAVAMVAFNQEWHVEEERPIGDELPPVDPQVDDKGGSGRTASKRSGSGRATGRRTTGTSSPLSFSSPLAGSSQAASSPCSRITGIRSWIGATTSPGSVVTIVQECTDEPSERHASAQSPANANGSFDGRVIQTGFLPVSSARHS
jgi:energy-coupling factor transporter transmembrane protein EcfT